MELYRKYIVWCEKHREDAVSTRKFSLDLCAWDHELEKCPGLRKFLKKRTSEGVMIYVYGDMTSKLRKERLARGEYVPRRTPIKVERLYDQVEEDHANNPYSEPYQLMDDK